MLHRNTVNTLVGLSLNLEYVEKYASEEALQVFSSGDEAKVNSICQSDDETDSTISDFSEGNISIWNQKYFISTVSSPCEKLR